MVVLLAELWASQRVKQQAALKVLSSAGGMELSSAAMSVGGRGIKMVALRAARMVSTKVAVRADARVAELGFSMAARTVVCSAAQMVGEKEWQ